MSAPHIRDKMTRRITVLLVEDDSAVRASMIMGMGNRDFEILEAGSGLEALEMSRDPSTVFDVVVADLVMPLMYGHEFAAQLAQIRPQTPVVYISGMSEDEARDRGYRTGSEPFFAKPFPPIKLAAKLKELVLGEILPAFSEEESMSGDV